MPRKKTEDYVLPEAVVYDEPKTMEELIGLIKSLTLNFNLLLKALKG